MQFLVALDCLITVGDADQEGEDRDEVIEAHLDEVMDELMRLDARDASIELDLTNGSVSFSVLVGAVNPLDAVNRASALVRSAIHAAEGATPDWPGLADEAWSVQLVALRSEPVEAPDSESDDVELVAG